MASLKFELSADGASYRVVGVGLFGKNTEAVDIPAEYKGLPVTAIGDRAFYQLMKLRSVTIPDSVKSIGAYSFWRCFRMTDIVIPDSVTSIGAYAFQYCDGLTDITIPETVTAIEENAFAGCGILTIRCDATDKPAGWSDDWHGDTPVAWKVLPENQHLEFKLNGTGDAYSVAGIGAFEGVELELPEEYKGKPVVAIEKEAFSGCERLTSVTVPETVTRIGAGAFKGCKNLQSINVDAYNKAYSSIDGNLYNEDGTVLVQYATGKTDTSFAVPHGVTVIGNSAFFGVCALREVTIPDGVTKIGDNAFDSCKDIASVTIPDSVTALGFGAFFSCDRLRSVSIGCGVTRILPCTFGSCLCLEEIFIHKGIVKIDGSVFSRCTSLKGVFVDEDNPEYKSVDGNLYSKDGTVLIHYAAGKTDVSFTIPRGVAVIGDYAFSYCDRLMAVSIPDGVRSIGRYAFITCGGLTSAVIPEGVTDIGTYAFFSCTALKSVDIPESGSVIGSRVFSGCRRVTLHCAAAQKPDGWDASWSEGCPVVWDYKGE